MRPAAILSFILLLLPASGLYEVVGVQKKTVEPRHFAVTQSFSDDAKDPALRVSSFLLSPNTVIDPQDGSIRLAHSVLLADETGATDYRQTETLEKGVYAKKVFEIDDPRVTSAELFFYGSAKEVLVNGKHVVAPKRLISTGWRRAAIAPKWLNEGKNEFLFRGGGQLLVEPGKSGRSWKSQDDGKTWSQDNLTDKANQRGEYLVRLRLGRYAPRGWAKSQIIDLWQRPDQDIPLVSTVSEFAGVRLSNYQEVPGTNVTAWIRTGSTPSPHAKSWTNWRSAAKPFEPDAETSRHRWAQLKFELIASKPQATPRLRSGFGLSYTLEQQTWDTKSKLCVVRKSDCNGLLIGSVPFSYQKPSARLKLLRERYQLDKVVAAGKTEMEKLMLLRHWVRNQWHTGWGNHPAQWMPPWDALIILENNDQPECLTMCTHYAAVFTQCCLALGWNARHCILDHHCVAEVYVNELGRWVMMDAGNSPQRADVTLHFEEKGVPLSARALHLAYHTGKTGDIRVCFTPKALREAVAPLCRPAPPVKEKVAPLPDSIALSELDQYPVFQLDNYRRFALPGRNNYLESLLPGELYQGWSPYFYDGYYWVGDFPDEPAISPEYSLHLSALRAHEVDWKLNWTRIYLSRSASAPAQLRVDLQTFTPNFLRFERTAATAGNDDKIVTADSSPHFEWKLKPGLNTLSVRSVNEWNKSGMPANLIVRYAPAKN